MTQHNPRRLDVQAYPIGRLRRLAGLGPGSATTPTASPSSVGSIGTNLLAVIPGRDLPNEYVFAARTTTIDTRSDVNGACFANGTRRRCLPRGHRQRRRRRGGVRDRRAIKKLPTAPRRSVVLALWDSEEDGLLGSLYYKDHPIVPLAQTKGYVNFDILGENLLPSLRETSFAIGAETGGSAFQAFVADAIATEGLDTELISFIFGQLRSDYVNFVNGGVPTVFFSDADGSCYHTIGDTIKIVNTRKLKSQSRIAYRVTLDLAEGATTPAFKAPNPALAVFADAEALGRVIARGQADLPLFAPPEQAALQTINTNIAQIVADGPGAFDSGDVGTLLGSALQTIAAVKTLPCGKM